MSVDRVTFPTRRHGPVLTFIKRTWAAYETASLRVLGVVLVIAGVLMLCGQEIFGRAV